MGKETFADYINEIKDNPIPHVWKTDTGHIFNGVLVYNNNNLILRINSKQLEAGIDYKFNYIYLENEPGTRRILYPSSQTTNIRKTYLDEYWPVNINYFIDESIPGLADKKTITFTFESFLYLFVPEKDEDKAKFEKLSERMRSIETSIGKVSVFIPKRGSNSAYGSLTYEMKNIVIEITSENEVTDDTIFLWKRYFENLLTFIHQERVVLRSIKRGFDEIVIPNILEYKKEKYAYRQFITLEIFSKIISQILPKYISNGESYAKMLQDLIRFYFDYSMGIPDEIQLLRLFTSLETCSKDHCKKNPIQPSLTDEEINRKEEFEQVVNHLKEQEGLPISVKKFIEDSKKFYISPENKNSLKKQIQATAEYQLHTFNSHSCLLNPNNINLQYKMRNILVHGFSDKKTYRKFYEQRLEFVTDIEQMVRIHILNSCGADVDVINTHKLPLRAHNVILEN